MSDYQVTQIGAPDEWREHFGGFDESRSRDGRRVVDHELSRSGHGRQGRAERLAHVACSSGQHGATALALHPCRG